MKNLILIFAMLLGGTYAFGQSAQIAESLKKGDAETLGNFLDEELELCFYNDEDIFAKPEALDKLRAFFAENPPVSFTRKHSGGQDNSKYVIGHLKTKEKDFRVFIYIENEGSQTVIREMRFEKPRGGK